MTFYLDKMSELHSSKQVAKHSFIWEMIKYEKLSNHVSASKAVPVNQHFMEDGSITMKCSHDFKEHEFTFHFNEMNWDQWNAGDHDECEYMVAYLDRKSFKRYGNLPYVVFRGHIGTNLKGKRHVYILDFKIYNIGLFDEDYINKYLHYIQYLDFNYLL